MKYIIKFYFIIHCLFIVIKGHSQELLITEVMYDPTTSCPEYLEISNLENKQIRFDQLKLQKNNSTPITLDFPTGWTSGESRIFTSDKSRFMSCFNEVNEGVVYEGDLFALTNSGARLILSSEYPVEMQLDNVNYSPSDHNEFLSDTKGVALERNILYPKSNKWRSGFVQFGYRSPGFIPEWEEWTDIEISFSASTIHPEGNFGSSTLEIEIGTEDVDGSITIEVFDVNGRNVQTIAEGVPLQGGEIFIWNGRSKSAQLLPEGLYLFWIYYFDTKGHKRIFKRTCVLSGN